MSIDGASARARAIHHRRWASACLAVCIALCVTRAAPARADGCLSTSDVTCPGAGPKSSGKRASAVIHAPPPTRNAPKGKPAPAPPPKSQDAVERRRFAAGTRTKELLVKELQGLEQLLASTPRSAGDRPGIVRRLGDGYAELAAWAERAGTEATLRAQQAERAKKPAKADRDEAVRDKKLEDTSRREAIKRYAMLAAQHPSYCQSSGKGGAKPTGCVDEVLYDLAYENERIGDVEAARKVYLEIVQKHPQSKYLPHAYLAFGELFFQEAQGDASKWPLAQQAYDEVVKFPPPENRVFGYAHYKLAHVYWAQGDHARALSELKRTIDFGVQFAALPNASSLAVAARRDLVPVYAVAGDGKKALELFRTLSGDAAGESTKTMAMAAQLGQALLDVGRYDDAIALYEELVTRDEPDKSCDHQAQIAVATMARRSSDKDAIVAALGKQLDTWSRFSSKYPDPVRRACANRTAALVVETAMAWHLETVGSGDVRGTGDKKTMAAAGQLYDKILAALPKDDDWKGFEFPRIVAEDWPSLRKVQYTRADLFYAAKEWRRCATAFDDVVKSDPKGPLSADAAFGAAVCWQNVDAAKHEGKAARRPDPPGRDSQPRDLDETERAMVGAFERYVCYVEPKKGDREGEDRLVEIEYARARTLFDARHWQEAAAAFRRVATSHPDHDAAPYAAQLYLEALNVAATKTGKEACLDDLTADAPKLEELFCKGEKPRAGADQCTGLARVARDVRRFAADRIVAGAAKAKDPAAELERGANAYLAIWKDTGRAACAAKDPACAGMDEVLHDAAKAFQGAQLLGRSIAVRKMLVDAANGLSTTALGREALRDLGANYQAIAVYDEAAGYYERFAHDAPKHAKAAEALRDAIVLRLGLGDVEQAMKDADAFQKSFAASRPAEAAQVAFAIGAHHADHEDWPRARKVLSTAMGTIDRNGTLDVRIQAHALLGRVLTRVGGATAARAEFERVRDLSRDPAALVEKIDALGGDEAEKSRRAGKVLSALGEAVYFFADERRREVDAIRFPEYRGSGSREDVLRHVKTKVAQWVEKKRPAIEDVERAFVKILEIRPTPPRWAIAAGARVGQTWSKFVAEFRAAPIPKEWLQHGMSPSGATWDEIRAAYYEALDTASEPFRQRAKKAYADCLDRAVTFSHFDDSAKSCERWLSRNYATEYHAVEELRPAPTHLAGVLADRGRPATLVTSR